MIEREGDSQKGGEMEKKERKHLTSFIHKLQT